MENSEIMEKLMQNDSHSEWEKNVGTSTKESAKWEESRLSKIRVVTAKYKLFIVLLLIFICVLLLHLIPNADNARKNSKSQYDLKKQDLQKIESDIRIANNNMDLLTWIIYNESIIKSCLNSSEACDSLPEDWHTSVENQEWESNENIQNIEKYNLRVPLSYLQTHSLYNEKMDVDEKTILRNLNEYLIRPKMEGKDTVGQLLKISIWDPEVLGYKKVTNSNKRSDIPNFFKVPVEVEIEFSTIWDLIDFLYNVEKKIIDKWEDRILYKIQTVSYDIIANDEPQITDIEMVAYYYYDEDFLKADESGKLKEINEYDYYFNKLSNDNSEVEINDSTDNSSNEDKWVEESNKGSFLDKIFDFNL